MEKIKELNKVTEKIDVELHHSLNEQDNSSLLNLVSQIKPINSNISKKKNTEKK